MSTSAAPDATCLKSGGGPEMNTDISGPGVRISFYLQAYFLSLLSARSASLEQITGALYTLVATNVAMSVTSFILGFKQEPGMSLHDAIVVFYLLSLSWASVFTSLPAYNRFIRSDRTLQSFSVIQSYLIFAWALAVIITAPTFGSTPRCNLNAVAVIFRQFPVLNAGRFVACATLAITIIVYSFLSFTDYRRSIIRRYRTARKWFRERISWVSKMKIKATAFGGRIGLVLSSGKRHVPGTYRDPQTAAARPTGTSPNATATSPNTREEIREDKEIKAKTRKDEKERRKTMNLKLGRKHTYLDNDATVHPRRAPKGYDAGLSGTLLIELIVITIVWALFVMNTELVIVRNHFADGGGDGLGSDLWQFGQILPMFLTVLPLVNLIKVFRKLRFSRRIHRRRVHRRRTRAERRETRSGKHAEAGTEESAYAFEEPGMGSPGQHSLFGSGRSAMPFGFTQARLDVTGFSSQPTARISLHSFHATDLMHVRQDSDSERSQGGYRRHDSVMPIRSFSSSSSYLSPSNALKQD